MDQQSPVGYSETSSTIMAVDFATHTSTSVDP